MLFGKTTNTFLGIFYVWFIAAYGLTKKTHVFTIYEPAYPWTTQNILLLIATVSLASCQFVSLPSHLCFLSVFTG